jgi:hypothetical protein
LVKESANFSGGKNMAKGRENKEIRKCVALSI